MHIYILRLQDEIQTTRLQMILRVGSGEPADAATHWQRLRSYATSFPPNFGSTLRYEFPSEDSLKIAAYFLKKKMPHGRIIRYFCHTSGLIRWRKDSQNGAFCVQRVPEVH